MKKTVSIILILTMAVSVCACGEKPGEVVIQGESPAPVYIRPAAAPEPTAQPAPESTPAPEEPSFPPVWDEALNAVLDQIADDVRPGSSGCSLRAIGIAAQLLDWAHGSALSDDEVYSAVQCWMETLDTDRLISFLDSVLNVYDACYDLRTDRADELMESAGVAVSAWPWSDAAFRRVEMVSYACGQR